MKSLLLIFNMLFSIPTWADLPDKSLYNIEGEWVDYDGKTITLEGLKGQKIVMSLVYLTCEFLCPMVITDIQKIEKALKKDAKLKIVLVSFDPQRDTAEKMKEYLVKRKLDLKRWYAIAPKGESQLRQLTGVLNFRFKKTEDGEYSHSFVIVGLDDNGVIQHEIQGANKDPKELVQFLNAK